MVMPYIGAKYTSEIICERESHWAAAACQDAHTDGSFQSSVALHRNSMDVTKEAAPVVDMPAYPGPQDSHHVCCCRRGGGLLHAAGQVGRGELQASMAAVSV